MQSKMSVGRLSLHLKGLCPNLEAVCSTQFCVLLPEETRGNSMNASSVILVWEQHNPNTSVFHSGFVGSTQAALWHQKGWAGHRKYQVALSSLNHSCFTTRRVLTLSGVYRCSEIFKRGVSSVLCFIFKRQETLLPPKSVPVKRMKL